MKQDNKTLEQQEIHRMVANGVPFSISYPVTKRTWYGKKRTEIVNKEYRIEEPTLGTLDRICQLSLEIELNDQEYAKLSDLGRIKLMVTRYAMTACKIIATAILGNEYRELIARKGRIAINELDSKVASLANVIYNSTRPSQLREIMIYILATNNLADFSSSIMLIATERSSRPNMIEVDQEV